ncbi:MAG: hypothetical protein ACRDWH_07175 [Acidimicrobiia bacterium]
MRGNPLPGAAVPIEANVARHMVGRALYVMIPVVGVGWLLRGPSGAGAAALGLGIVVLNLWLAGKVLSVGMRVSLTMYHAAALVGFILRMALIAGTMLLVVRFIEIDRYAFGVSAVVSYLVLVTLEAISIMRDGERNWIG